MNLIKPLLISPASPTQDFLSLAAGPNNALKLATLFTYAFCGHKVLIFIEVNSPITIIAALDTGRALMHRPATRRRAR